MGGSLKSGAVIAVVRKAQNASAVKAAAAAT